jgi:hypothetical protein
MQDCVEHVPPPIDNGQDDDDENCTATPGCTGEVIASTPTWAVCKYHAARLCMVSWYNGANGIICDALWHTEYHPHYAMVNVN